MVNSVAPYPYTHPYIREEHWNRDGQNGMSVATSLGTIEGPTDRIWRLIEPLLIGIGVLADQEQVSLGNSSGRIVRVELIRRNTCTAYELIQQGAVLFDQTGVRVCYIRSALIGYSGSGPTLTSQLFGALGISQDLFEEINTNSTQPGYHVVVSRQQVEKIDGVMTAPPYAAPLDEWTWWHATQ